MSGLVLKLVYKFLCSLAVVRREKFFYLKTLAPHLTLGCIVCLTAIITLREVRRIAKKLKLSKWLNWLGKDLDRNERIHYKDLSIQQAS